MVVARGTKSNEGLAGAHIWYTWFEDVSLGESDWVRETHGCKSGVEIYFSLVL